MRRLLSIGECMVEMSQAEGGLWRLGYAGDTFNTAWHARRALGDEWQVGYLSAVGDDLVSDGMLGFIAGAGIDTAPIRRIEGAMPGLYMIHLSDGERSFSYWRGQSAARRLAEDTDHLAEALAGAECVYFSGITLAILPPEGRETLLSGLAAAREAGAMIAFDSNLRPRLWETAREMTAAVEAAARVSTIALPSAPDEIAAFGAATPAKVAERYRAAGVAEVVVKNGPDPVLLVTGNEETEIATQPVRPVDTTGAGDSFNGSYLAARLEGASPADAVRAAHETASRVVMAHGALA